MGIGSGEPRKPATPPGAIKGDPHGLPLSFFQPWPGGHAPAPVQAVAGSADGATTLGAPVRAELFLSHAFIA